MDKFKKLVEQKTVEAMFKELKRHKMLKDGKQTPFQKTETLLYNYPKFKEALESKYDEINFIKEEGVSKRSKGIVQWSSGSNYDSTNDYDRAEDAIERIVASIDEIERHIRRIDWSLSIIKDDSYFEIIKMKYFEGSSQEYISEYFEVDIGTIRRHKNRLINILQIRLFSDEVLMGLLE